MTIFQPDRFLLARFVASHAPAMTGTVLDCGCGSARYRSLFSHVDRYIRLDPNPAVHPDILAPAEAIPLPDASVDHILCTQVLGDVSALSQAIAEMARVLKPSGTLLLTESLHAELHDEPYDFWRFTPDLWKQLLQERFVIAKMETRGGYFSLRCQQHIRRLILRFHLYDRPLLGRLANLYATCIGRIALWRDAHDAPEMRRKFAIGFNLIARKQ